MVRILAILLILLATTACAGPQPAPAATRTPRPTATIAPTRTARPTRTTAPTRTPRPTAVTAPTRTPRSTATTGPSRTPRPTAAATVSRCQPASPAQLAVIRDGVQGLEPGNDIKTAWAVRSTEFERVYVVAARIYGAGIPAEGAGPGVWAISGDPDAPGLVLAVDGFAKQFTSYPDASQTDARITMATDGASAAQTCAQLNP